jgi:hypothetical protein
MGGEAFLYCRLALVVTLAVVYIPLGREWKASVSAQAFCERPVVISALNL